MASITHRRCLLPSFLLLSFAFASTSASGQCLLVDELKTSGSGSTYGHEIATSGDWAAVSDLFGVANSISSGTVTMFQHDGAEWVEQQTVFPNDGASSDLFGSTLDLEGTRLVVCSPADDDQGFNSGSVYVFDYDGTTWNQTAKLQQTGGGGSNREYGRPLDLDGDLLVCAATNSSVDLWRYVGGFVGWQLEQTISDTGTFADSVAIAGNQLLVGHPTENSEGGVFVYDDTGSGWTLQTILKGSQTDSGDRFGTELTVDGDRLLIGDTNEGTTGSVYVFERQAGSWSEAALFASASVNRFGTHLALEGDTALIGGHSTSLAAEYRLVAGQWIEATLYTDGRSELGRAVALSGDRALIGARDGALEFPARTMRLLADNENPAAGDVVNLRTTPGPPNSLVLLYVVEVNAVPFSIRLATFKFSNEYSFNIQTTIPAGLSGLDVGLQSFGLAAGGVAQFTNVLVLDMQ